MLKGSDGRGYGWFVDPPSSAHLNVIAPSLNLTYSPLLNPWEAIVGSNTPVEGVYVAVVIVCEEVEV